jgi:hypothetical protein
MITLCSQMSWRCVVIRESLSTGCLCKTPSLCLLLAAVYRNWVRDQVDKDPELAAQWQQWEAQVRTTLTLLLAYLHIIISSLAGGAGWHPHNQTPQP